MQKIFTTLAFLTVFSLQEEIYAQGLMGKIQRVKNGLENASRNIEESEAKKQEANERNNPPSVAKSDFHTRHIGKILFAKGGLNPELSDESQFVQAVDLKNAHSFNVYLEDPMYNIMCKHRHVKEFDVVVPVFTRKYYINNELIASYTDNMDQETFRQKAVFADVLVPANKTDFHENEFRVGVLAHVFSTLTDGKHRLKVEYILTVAKELPNTTGSAAREFENQEILMAAGEVDVHVNRQDRDAYCKAYGRPKFDKGVLQGQAQLEQRIAQLIRSDTKRDPIYIYAADNWTIVRGALDRVIARESRVFYVFKNQNGRAELADCKIKQEFDGQNYQNPAFGFYNYSPAFRYVCLQNY